MRVSACDGRYLSLAQQKRAWEELNRIFGGQTPTPPGPDPPVVSDWSVYFSDQAAAVHEILMDEDVQARLITIEYSGETMPEPVALPVFTLYGSPGEFVMLVTELNGQVPCEGGLLLCGLFRNGEFVQQYSNVLNPTQGLPNRLLVEMFSCDGMGIVTYMSNLSPESEVTGELWTQTYSYDWAEGEMPAVCFMGMTVKESGSPMGSYSGTMGFAVLKEEV